MAKRVFVSSTRLDLKDCREAVRDAISRLGFLPEMMELWDASENRPLKECRDKVEGCDVVVAIVARRYGWVPANQFLAGGQGARWCESSSPKMRRRLSDTAGTVTAASCISN